LKYYRDMKNVTDTAFQEGEVKGKIEGKIEGLAEGEAKGKIEGLAEGEAKGKMEERLKTIEKAIRRGKLSDTEIAEDCEVSLDAVQQIRAAMT
jgi:flagellar biosynthesis/type III secretory pathway protein FliH